MSRAGAARRMEHMSTPLRPRTTTAFFTQSVISFAVSLGVTIAGIGYLHDSRWIRGFLALGLNTGRAAGASRFIHRLVVRTSQS
jgi:hypothetical protein